MSSQVGGDLTKIESGPCKLTYKSATLGHTMGGVKFNAPPAVRRRQVDEYGTNVVEILHQGDELKVSCTLAEKSMAVLQTVYAFGYSVNSKTWGIGRTPGTKGSAVGGPLVVHPLDGVSAEDDLNLFVAVVAEVSEVQFGDYSQDRVFACTFEAIVDETKTNGKLLGTIGAALT